MAPLRRLIPPVRVGMGLMDFSPLILWFLLLLAFFFLLVIPLFALLGAGIPLLTGRAAARHTLVERLREE